MSENNSKFNFQVFFDEICFRIQEIFPYFFVFYLFSLLISLFFRSWKLWFDWSSFHLIIIVSLLLYCLTLIRQSKEEIGAAALLFKNNGSQFVNTVKNVRSNWKRPLMAIKIIFLFVCSVGKKQIQLLLGFTARIFTLIISKSQIAIKYLFDKISLLSRLDWYKLMLISAVMVFSIYFGINPFIFLILLFGMIAVLFKLDVRWSAGLAIFFLAMCPFLIIYKADKISENLAIYAYYFLIITILTQMRGDWAATKVVSVDNINENV